ncbi:MAG: hypothetical protein GEV07_21705 [Streptosporangiales bacterium]|nr:hypothetical protein [Streptosporangiales bacterium]
MRLCGESRATGLLVHAGDPPRVAGVRTTHGDRQADVVIDASGRRSPIGAWLEHEAVGQSDRIESECGLSYYTRRYRPRPGATWPEPRRLSPPHFGLVVCTADNDMLSVAVCPATEDRTLRA